MLLGLGGGRFICLWHCRLLSEPLGEQTSGRCDCLGLGYVARWCFGTKWYSDVPGHGVPEMVTSAMRTTVVLLIFFNLTISFAILPVLQISFAMTSGLASDSDKFKIIITLCWAQKFGDTRPYKNFDFLFNRLTVKFFGNLS